MSHDYWHRGERDVLLEFAKALVETPLTIILLILDLIGLAAVIYWVVDDLSEGFVVFIFLLVIFVRSYLIFRKVRRQLFVQQHSQPSVEYAEARQAQMYHDSPVVKGRTATYHTMIRRRNLNAPRRRSNSRQVDQHTRSV